MEDEQVLAMHALHDAIRSATAAIIVNACYTAQLLKIQKGIDTDGTKELQEILDEHKATKFLMDVKMHLDAGEAAKKNE